nr:U32 family peptidase [Clostridia bacterium]
MTLNTAVLDRELDGAVRYAAKLYAYGVDALIVADLGLASLIRKYVPGLPLHASTQVSGHNTEAARFLCERGFERMVAAREMSKDALARLCADSPIEIECFIHGAHCVSHSGQCLMSWVQGGRSGNRGECAQPCRMKYKNGYPLSLKDMTLSNHVPELIELGVKSLKIEGRMKSPDYVYGVVSIWRRLLDEGRNANPKEAETLAKLFSRSGFTDGYFAGNIGMHMLGVRTESDKTASKTLSPNKPPNQRLIKPRGQAIKYDRKMPELPEVIYEKGQKLRTKPSLTAVFRSDKQIPSDFKADITALPLEVYTPKANAVVLPPVIYDADIPKIEAALASAKEKGAEFALLGNIGHIEIAKRAGLRIHGTFRFNIQNGENCRVLTEAGLEAVTLSPELTLPQIRDIVSGHPAAVIAYGRIPVMLLEKPLGTNVLIDRLGARFPIVKEGGKDIILNSIPTSMVGDKYKKKLREIGCMLRTYNFTDEKPDEVMRIMRGEEDMTDYRRIK